MTLNELSLEKKLASVSNSQASIQSLSFFCLHYKTHHKKIVQIWLRCLQKSGIPHRLNLIHLANDIVQNAKRKNVPSFIEDFKTVLKDAVPYLRDEKIRKSVERVFSIWRDRSIFDAKFITDLKNGLNNVKIPNELTKSDSQRSTPKVDPISRQPSDEIIECLNKLTSIEKHIEKIKLTEDNVVIRLADGPLPNDLENNLKVMNDLKAYIIHLRREVDERAKISKLLESSLSGQRKMLRDAEIQLVSYKSQLDHLAKLRDDLSAI